MSSSSEINYSLSWKVKESVIKAIYHHEDILVFYSKKDKEWKVIETATAMEISKAYTQKTPSVRLDYRNINRQDLTLNGQIDELQEEVKKCKKDYFENQEEEDIK